jgi:ATP-dependent Clp protease ATP-binding subunit ClpA
LCRALADKDYHSDTGARSLESAVNRKLRNPALQKYLEGNILVRYNDPPENYIADIDSNGNIFVERV